MVERLTGWRLAVVATLLSAFVSLGFSIASVVAPALIVPGAERVQVAAFAGYALSRSVAIAVASVFAAMRRNPAVLVTVGWIAGGVQALDVLVGIAEGDLVKAAGPAALAAFSAYALLRLSSPRPGAVDGFAR